MKKLLFALALLSIGCSDEQALVDTPSTADIALQKSAESVASAHQVSIKSDIATKKQITKVVFKIKYLTNEIVKFKTERLTLISQLSTVKEKVRIDTVYIEKKKNFWGKEKTNTTVKSDSLVNEKIDSTTTSKLDTLGSL
jgi:hypothetical protein